MHSVLSWSIPGKPVILIIHWLIDFLSLSLILISKNKQKNKQTLIYTPFHFPFPAAPPVSKVDEKLKAAEARRAELARVKAEELQKK